MKQLAATAALAVVLLAGCNDRNAANAPVTNEPEVASSAATPNSVPPAGVGNEAQSFASEVAAANRLEIEASRIALEKTKTPAVREFAQMMIDDHTAAEKSLTQALANVSNVNLPQETLDADGQALVGNLRSANPDGFDDRYLDTMVDSHETTVERVRTYANEGETPALKQWATTTLPKLEAHLQRAQAVRKQVNES